MLYAESMRILCLLLLPFTASAMGSLSGYCTQGGQKVFQNGIPSTTQVMQSYPQCSVSVFYTGGPSGAVSTSGTAVTLAYGSLFNASGQWSTLHIVINSVTFTIASVSSATSLTLTTSAGTQSTVVYSMAATTPAPVFTANGSTLANPFTSSLQGYWQFYAPDNQYDIRLSGGGIPAPFTWGAQDLMNPLYTAPGGIPVPYPVIASQFVDVRSYGAVCNGTTPDDAGFAAAIAAAPSGSTIVIPAFGCVLATGINITKPLTLSSGAPSYPSAQLLAGANNITMITVSFGRTNFAGLQFDANGKTGVTPISISNASDDSLDRVLFNGPFTQAVLCSNSYFINFKDVRIFGANQGLTLSDQCNSVTTENLSIYGQSGSQTTGVLFNNSQSLTMLGTTIECGVVIVTFNSYGIKLAGGYAENGGGCPSMISGSAAAYIGIGGFFGGSPAFGVDISGWLFNGTAAYGVSNGYGRGLSVHGNTFQTTTYAIAQNASSGVGNPITNCTVAAVMVCTSAVTPFVSTASVLLSGFVNTGGHDWTGANASWVATVLSPTTFSVPFNSSALVTFSGQSATVASYYPAITNFDLGANDYGTLSEANIVGFINAAYNDSTATNTTKLQVTPWLLSYAMPQPQPSHVPSGDAALYWSTPIASVGPQPATPALLSMLNNVGGTLFRNLMLNQFECVPQETSPGNGDSCKIDGPFAVRPYGLVATANVIQVFDNTHRVYLGEAGSSEAILCGGGLLPYAAFLCTNDNEPIQFGTGATYRGGWLTTGSGFYVVPTVFAGLGTCDSTTEGSSVPITNSNTNTPGATISGTGAFHGFAHCNGTNWVFNF